MPHARAASITHGRGSHVVDARARSFDDRQGGRLADGCLGACFLPAATQTLGETQVGEGGVSLLHRGGDVGARGRGAQGAGRRIDEGFDTHPSTLGA